MKFQVGDMVMHWNYGLGQITGIEERMVMGKSQLYYELRIKDLNIWVPVDNLAGDRMRPPTSARSFKKLLVTLSTSAEELSEDRHERKVQLHSKMSDGTAESICCVLRDLTNREQKRPLNDDDKTILQKARTMLLREWEYSLRVPAAKAETDLVKALKSSHGQQSDSREQGQRSSESGEAAVRLR